MGIKEKAKKAAATAAGVSLTTTLSNCGNDPVVADPPPPPLECPLVGEGQTLFAMGWLSIDTLTAEIRDNSATISEWQGVEVSDLVGATLVGIEIPSRSSQPIVLTLKLETPSTTTGSFKLSGTLRELQLPSHETFAVERTFTFTVSGGDVVIAMRMRDTLPLLARHRAQIVQLGRDDGVVDLEARTRYEGRHTAAWSVAQGSIEVEGENRARWRLPEKPGIYQVQVVVDYGVDGLGFDEMMVEVG